MMAVATSRCSSCPGESLDVALVPVPDRPALLGKATVRHDDPGAWGSRRAGRRGRRASLGIADAVTVLAETAARADAAATLIANTVDLPGTDVSARAGERPRAADGPRFEDGHGRRRLLPTRR